MTASVHNCTEQTPSLAGGLLRGLSIRPGASSLSRAIGGGCPCSDCLGHSRYSIPSLKYWQQTAGLCATRGRCLHRAGYSHNPSGGRATSVWSWRLRSRCG
eukprot:scaffold1035_cov374-Prasinococcus_capsulatus_cf.AAC.4